MGSATLQTLVVVGVALAVAAPARD